MIKIDEFFVELKESIEAHSIDLKRGKLFDPEYLKGKVFSQSFKKVAKTLSKRLALKMRIEVRNIMPKPKELFGSYQIVDFVYYDGDKTHFFLEMESLDRAQLYLFSDIKLKSGEYTEENKLWYYLGTILKHINGEKDIPRYFVWLLILPDKKVDDYSNYLWDIKRCWERKEEYILHRGLKKLVFENPYRFYDHLIKTSARLFLEDKRKELKGKRLSDFQHICELVFLTCTGDRLIMSRGKDLFEPSNEKHKIINWHD